MFFLDLLGWRLRVVDRLQDVSGLIFLNELLFLGCRAALAVIGLLLFCLPKFQPNLIGEGIELSNFLFSIVIHQ
jgi:hypothetical protein